MKSALKTFIIRFVLRKSVKIALDTNEPPTWL